MTAKILTQARLKELLAYNPETGDFHRVVGRKGAGFSGTKAGSPSHGYVTIMIDGKNYRCHRLAWLYVYGEFPDGHLDHINRTKADNRIANLRIASKKQNAENTGIQSNNKSGYRGVFWNSQRSKWQACIKHHGKVLHLGFFDDASNASKAYKKKADELFTHHTKEKK
jgi:hypothetical protein